MDLDLVDYHVFPADSNVKITKVGKKFPPLQFYCTGEGSSPCETCSNNPKNGEVKVCCCQLGQPQVTC